MFHQFIVTLLNISVVTSTYSTTETFYSVIYRRYTKLRSNILHENKKNPASRIRNSRAY